MRRFPNGYEEAKQLLSEKDLIYFLVLFEEVEKEGDAIEFLSLCQGWSRVLAGSIAGLSVLALDDSNQRRTLALYLLPRLGQAAYNSAKSKNKFAIGDMEIHCFFLLHVPRSSRNERLGERFC